MPLERQDQFEKYRLDVRMFGEFSIRSGDTVISDTGNRSYKTWLLLAYFLYHHHRMIPNTELLRMLGSHDDETVAPVTLRNLIHRTREILTALNIGEQCIIRGIRAYGWNPAIPVELDIDTFERHCKNSASAEHNIDRIAEMQQSIELFHSGFLPRYHYEPWVNQSAQYFLNLLIESALKAFSYVKGSEIREAIIHICRRILQDAPYEERIVCILMRELNEMKEYRESIGIYEKFRKYLYSELDVQPCDEAAALYQEALEHDRKKDELSLREIREKLEEGMVSSGPLLCEFSELTSYYRMEQRNIARRGDSIHLAVLTLYGKGGKPLSKRSLHYAMEKLRIVLVKCLRIGDVAAKCSSSQYVVMLIQSNFENSQMICERIHQAFLKECPWTSALLQSTVAPIETT